MYKKFFIYNFVDAKEKVIFLQMGEKVIFQREEKVIFLQGEEKVIFCQRVIFLLLMQKRKKE